jgi:hypothetical protein
MSINVASFNEEFTVCVNDICIPNGMHLGCIELIVKCTANNLVYYKEHSFNDQAYLDTATSQDLFNDAFAAHATEIQDWATTVQALPNIYSAYIPTANFITLGVTTFNDAFDVAISRYEVHPANQANSLVVNFNIGTTGSQFNQQAIIPIGTTNAEYMDVAWDRVKDNVELRATAIMAMDSLIGTLTIPSSF